MRTWCERSLSDDTFVYGCALEKEKTVEDVVNWILENELGEWGIIWIHDEKHSPWKNLAKCEYDHHRIKGTPFPNEYMSWSVTSMSANGGWGRMDFAIFVKRE